MVLVWLASTAQHGGGVFARMCACFVLCRDGLIVSTEYARSACCVLWCGALWRGALWCGVLLCSIWNFPPRILLCAGCFSTLTTFWQLTRSTIGAAVCDFSHRRDVHQTAPLLMVESNRSQSRRIRPASSRRRGSVSCRASRPSTSRPRGRASWAAPVRDWTLHFSVYDPCSYSSSTPAQAVAMHPPRPIPSLVTLVSLRECVSMKRSDHRRGSRAFRCRGCFRCIVLPRLFFIDVFRPVSCDATPFCVGWAAQGFAS